MRKRLLGAVIVAVFAILATGCGAMRCKTCGPNVPIPRQTARPAVIPRPAPAPEPPPAPPRTDPAPAPVVPPEPHFEPLPEPAPVVSADLPCDCEDLKKRVAALTAQIDGLNRQIRNLRNANGALARENGNLKGQVASLEQKIYDLRSERDQLLADKAALQKDKDDLTAANKVLAADRDDAHWYRSWFSSPWLWVPLLLLLLIYLLGHVIGWFHGRSSGARLAEDARRNMEAAQRDAAAAEEAARTASASAATASASAASNRKLYDDEAQAHGATKQKLDDEVEAHGATAAILAQATETLNRNEEIRKNSPFESKWVKPSWMKGDEQIKFDFVAYERDASNPKQQVAKYRCPGCGVGSIQGHNLESHAEKCEPLRKQYGAAVA